MCLATALTAGLEGRESDSAGDRIQCVGHRAQLDHLVRGEYPLFLGNALQVRARVRQPRVRMDVLHT